MNKFKKVKKYCSYFGNYRQITCSVVEDIGTAYTYDAEILKYV